MTTRPGAPERVYCSVPAYDEDGATLIGSCGWFLPGDAQARGQLARALGWQLDPVPLCPGHARVARARRVLDNRPTTADDHQL